MNIENENELITSIIENAKEIDYSIRLPDAEFEVLCAMWNGTPPVNTAYLMQKIGHKKGWKAPTLISFLVRLEDRGFIASYKNGKERYYIPLADRDVYVKAVTKKFVDQYHNGSFVSVMNALFSDEPLGGDDIDELLEWLKKRY